jgi:hypothetical protein
VSWVGSAKASWTVVDRKIRLGLEGLITFTKDTHEFNAEEYYISVPTPDGGQARIAVFDKIMVDVGIEKDANTQRGKVKVGSWDFRRLGKVC